MFDIFFIQPLNDLVRYLARYSLSYLLERLPLTGLARYLKHWSDLPFPRVLSLWATAGRPPTPPYARCPGLLRALSQVFFGPFTGDEHPQGTPYPFSSPNLGYLYPDLI